MNAPDIVKLAPTLSPEERYKLIAGDMLKRMDDKQPALSDSEQQALIRFDKRKEWEEYVLRVILFKFANSIWMDQMMIAKLRFYAFYLLANHQLERVVRDATDPDFSKEEKAAQVDALREYVKEANIALPDFLAYREAIPKLEQETYGVPIYSEETKEEIAQQFALVETTIGRHNESVQFFATHKELKKYLQPIAKDVQSYLLKKEPPAPALVEELLAEIKRRAESERASRL